MHTKGFVRQRGKVKQKHFLTLPDTNIIALCGIYGNRPDKESGEELTTFSIVTTAANKMMTAIHNTKQLMPIVLTKAMEKDWLTDRNIQDFAFRIMKPFWWR